MGGQVAQGGRRDRRDPRLDSTLESLVPRAQMGQHMGSRGDGDPCQSWLQVGAEDEVGALGCSWGTLATSLRP